MATTYVAVLVVETKHFHPFFYRFFPKLILISFDHFLAHSNSSEELFALPSRRPSSRPRKNCSSSPSSLLPLIERCPSESSRLGNNSSLSSMSPPSSSPRRPSWRTIYLTMLVVFLAFSLPTAGNLHFSLEILLPVGHSMTISACVTRVVARGTQTPS